VNSTKGVLRAEVTLSGILRKKYIFFKKQWLRDFSHHVLHLLLIHENAVPKEDVNENI